MRRLYARYLEASLIGTVAAATACGDEFSAATTPSGGAEAVAGSSTAGQTGGSTGMAGTAGSATGGSGTGGRPGTAGAAGSLATGGMNAGGMSGSTSGGSSGAGGSSGGAAGGSGTAGSSMVGGSAGSSGGSTPVVVADPPPSAVGAHNGFLALDDDHVYFSYQGTTVGGVARTPKVNPAVVCIECDVGIPRDLEVDATHVYWSDTGLGEIRREPLVGGTTPETLWTGTPGTPIALDAAGIYWHDAANHSVMRADLTGANPTVLAGSQPNVTSLHTDGGQLFWTTNAAVLVLDQASGNSPTSLATGRNSPQSVSADSTHVYWIEGTWANPDNTIVRMPRGGGAVQNVTAVGAADVFSIALDTRDVYAAGSSGGTIWRVSKTGGSPEFLATGLSYPFFIAVDATDIYFTSETTAQVFRLAK